MKSFFIFSVILLVSLFASSIHAFIGFERWYGHPVYVDERGQSVVQTSDGGYIVTGQAGHDVYLIKTDSLGDSTWAKTYGGIYPDVGYSVAQTTDEGYIITGHTLTFIPPDSYSKDVYLIKTDVNGDTLWTKTYGDTNRNIGYSVAQTTDGGYIITGETFKYVGSNNYSDVYLIKTDSSGDTLWTKKYGGTRYDCGYSVAQTIDGGYIIAGYITVTAGGVNRNVYLIKTDSLGNTEWTKDYGGLGSGIDEEGYSVTQTSDGGYIITGYDERDTNNSITDIYLIKTDSLGDTIWTRTYGGDSDDEGRSVAQTTDGGYIIAGETASFGAGAFDVYLIKTDSSGDTIWTRTYGCQRRDFAMSVQQTTDGGYIVAGASLERHINKLDVYLIKTGEDGNVGVKEAEEREEKREEGKQMTVYPNPFSTSTTICLLSIGHPDGTVDTFHGTSRTESIEIKIYDVSGRLVKDFSLTTGHSSLGTAVSWDGRDNKDKKVSPGIYFVKLSSGEFVAVEKIILVK